MTFARHWYPKPLGKPVDKHEFWMILGYPHDLGNSEYIWIKTSKRASGASWNRHLLQPRCRWLVGGAALVCDEFATYSQSRLASVLRKMRSQVAYWVRKLAPWTNSARKVWGSAWEMGSHIPIPLTTGPWFWFPETIHTEWLFWQLAMLLKCQVLLLFRPVKFFFTLWSIHFREVRWNSQLVYTCIADIIW